MAISWELIRDEEIAAMTNKVWELESKSRPLSELVNKYEFRIVEIETQNYDHIDHGIPSLGQGEFRPVTTTIEVERLRNRTSKNRNH